MITQDKPENINPDITKKFVIFMQETSQGDPYRVEVTIGDQVIPIDVFPTVFPPRSDYSISSKSVFETFGNLQDLEVADIGCGTGIESIVALMAGAKHVDAADNNPKAVDCSRHNIQMNGLDAIDIFHSDLFQNFPNKKYDVIIANLPIVNFQVEINEIHNALYDNNFEIHKRLFLEAKNFLKDGGIITFTHANLQSSKTLNPEYDFLVIENLIHDYGYKILEKIQREDLEYLWINYKITPRIED